jgi:hypothetical protein
MPVPAYLAETPFQNREQDPTTYTFRSPCRIEPLVTSTDDRQQAANFGHWSHRFSFSEHSRYRYHMQRTDPSAINIMKSSGEFFGFVLFLSLLAFAIRAEAADRSPISEGSIWMLPSTPTEQVWLEVHAIDGDGAEATYHISVLSKIKADPAWKITHVVAHMAITEVALRNGPLRPAPKSVRAAYPETYDAGYAEWIKLNSQGIAPICSTSVMKCLYPCRVNGETFKCGPAPVRKKTSQQIYVQIADDESCAIDGIASPCAEVGKNIRAEHPMDDPKVGVCASARSDSRAVGAVLGSLNDEYLTPAFGCPPR